MRLLERLKYLVRIKDAIVVEREEPRDSRGNQAHHNHEGICMAIERLTPWHPRCNHRGVIGQDADVGNRK
jgi:hypothetical protein